MLPGDQGLAQGRLVEAEHTRVPPDLVDKGLQQDALVAGLHVHGPDGWAHPPGAGSREKGGQRGPAASASSVCRLSVRPSPWPQLRGRVGQDALRRVTTELLTAGHRLRGAGRPLREEKTKQPELPRSPAHAAHSAPPRSRPLPQKQTAAVVPGGAGCRAGPDADSQGLAAKPKQLQSPPPGLRKPLPRSHEEVKSQF